MSNDPKQSKLHESDVAFIQSLAELLNDSKLSEISVKREDGEHDRLTVSLSKHGKTVAVQAAPAAAPAAPAAFREIVFDLGEDKFGASLVWCQDQQRDADGDGSEYVDRREP